MRQSGTDRRPLVSVIVPVYNRAGIIEHTIENIFEQTYSNLELIVVDDGSTDETRNVLASYGDRIRWTSQENAGPAAARNRGIRMAKGEIIAFQDSDDAWHPTKIERQVSVLERAGKSTVCCICNSVVEHADYVAISFEGAPIHPPIEEGLWTNPAEVLATRCMLFNQAVAVRKEALLKVGGFNESLRLLEDVELALRLALEGPWAFIRDTLATRQAKLERTLSSESTPIIVAENMVKILSGILPIVAESNDLASLRPLFEQELKRARRRLAAAQMRESDRLGSMLIGRTWEAIEHYRNAVYRRTPWFPRMQVARV